MVRIIKKINTLINRLTLVLLLSAFSFGLLSMVHVGAQGLRPLSSSPIVAADTTATCNSSDFVSKDCKVISNCAPKDGVPLSAGNCGIVKYLIIAINTLSAVVGVVVVIMIIVGGIQYSAAGDDPQKVQAAKSKITNALLALFVFIFMFAFLQWVVPGGIF